MHAKASMKHAHFSLGVGDLVLVSFSKQKTTEKLQGHIVSLL